MAFVWTAAVKDLRRRLADPAALLIWLGIPVALGALMSLIGGGGSTPPTAHVLVADQDDTAASRLLLTAAGGDTLGEFIDLEPVTLEDGRRRIDASEATALLVLPSGFEDAVLDRGDARLELITNPAQRILPGIVEEALDILVEGVFYGQRLLAPVVATVGGGGPDAPVPPSDADVAAISVEINRRVRELQGVLFPPVLALEVVIDRADAAAGMNFAQLFLPGLLFMSILFIAQGMSVDIWEEKTAGTLRRTLVTPQPAFAFLAGKIVAGMVLVAVVALAALLALGGLFDVEWRRVPAAFAWCTFTGGALLAMMLLLQTATPSERGAQLISNIVVFPLIMIGGSFFPFETMPGWMAAIGQWTPNGLAVVRLKDLLYGQASAQATWLAAVGIGAPAVVCFVVAGRRLRGRFATG